MTAGSPGRMAARPLVLYSAMAVSGGALVSGLILWVDLYELLRGTVDAQLCDLPRPDADMRFAGGELRCDIRPGYVGLALLYGLAIVPFWLLAAGAPMLAILNFARRSGEAPSGRARILEATVVYVVAVVALSAIGAASSSWYFGAFRESVWPFLLAPAVLFPAALYLGPPGRDAADADHPD